jgi:DNA polymerase-1
MKRLYLVDVSSMFFRAFYAIPPLTSKSGLPTNALFGFLNMTLKLLREDHPEYLAFCFDTKEPSFRSEIYSDYKANRDEMPDDLKPQIPYVKKFTELLGIKALEQVGFEADDIIGSLAKVGLKHDVEIHIISGDKDFAQLVGPKVVIQDSMRDITYDVPGVKAKWGIRPDQMIDYLALVGDSSDNVPGVKGIGPKTALKLLTDFETLDGVYKNLDKLKGSVLTKLQECKEQAYMSQKLVTIETDMKLNVDLDDLKMSELKKDELVQLLKELDFNSFAKQVEAGTATAPGKAKSAVKKAASTPTEAANFDNEFTLTLSDASAATQDVKAGNGGASKQAGGRVRGVTYQVIGFEDFKKMLEPFTPLYVFQNERGLYFGIKKTLYSVDAPLIEVGKLLLQKLCTVSGFSLKKIFRDLQLSESPPIEIDIEIATHLALSTSVSTFAEAFEAVFSEAIPDLASPEEFYQMHLRLKEEVESRIEAEGLKIVLDKYETPLVPVLTNMEIKGVLIDKPLLATQSKQLVSDIAELETKIFKESGETFNVASPKQLATVLFDKMKIPPVKKTKTGYSTDSDVLDKLSKEYPIALLITEHRELSKLKSTYVDSLPELVQQNSGRIHTTYNQSVTTTGRLSSTNPNLQNIPIRTERGREVRKAFIAPPGFLLLSVDYSQIELRILAHIADDKGLQKAFAEDLDIHAATASEVFGVGLDQVTADLRRTAKAINFGIAYGQGAFGLAEQLGISRTESAEIIEKYFKKFSGVKEYMETIVKKVHETGYVETLFGRKRVIKEIKSSNQAVRKFGERAAINAPIQGTASDLMKLAMIEVFSRSPVQMLLQVHDEILFEVAEEHVERESKALKTIMESVAQLKVPLRVNVAWGQNWEDAHA